jgi:antitoxin (DNA-binding transcriptional repressor) of toxin-antitoxin stability system
MQTVNIHEAKTHLSRLVEKAAKGNVFINVGREEKIVALKIIDVYTKSIDEYGRR